MHPDFVQQRGGCDHSECKQKLVCKGNRLEWKDMEKKKLVCCCPHHKNENRLVGRAEEGEHQHAHTLCAVWLPWHAQQ